MALAIGGRVGFQHIIPSSCDDEMGCLYLNDVELFRNSMKDCYCFNPLDVTEFFCFYSLYNYLLKILFYEKTFIYTCSLVHGWHSCSR